MDTAVFHCTMPSPFGPMQIGVDSGGALVGVWLPNRGRILESHERPPHAARMGMDAAQAQLHEYFLGTRRTFDLRIDPHGSSFERNVWSALQGVPFGVTTSYGAIAAQLGLTNGARAVGRANGANPIPIVIPCHRVIGSDGRLTGYGGGLPLKRALLELEGALPANDLRLF